MGNVLYNYPRKHSGFVLNCFKWQKKILLAGGKHMINTIDGIISAARGGKPGVIAVAAAHDQPVIEAVVEARREGIAAPILVGHVDEIKSMLAGLGEDPAA